MLFTMITVADLILQINSNLKNNCSLIGRREKLLGQVLTDVFGKCNAISVNVAEE